MVFGVFPHLHYSFVYHSPKVVVQVESVYHDWDQDEQEPVEGNFCEDEEQQKH